MMKFDRIALKIIFFILISGLILMSNVAISQTPIQWNNPPRFSDGRETTRRISENAGPGTNIGAPVSATDEDNDSLTYALHGTEAASFSIVSTTGQLKTKAALNATRQGSYHVELTVFDGTDKDWIDVIKSM